MLVLLFSLDPLFPWFLNLASRALTLITGGRKKRSLEDVDEAGGAEDGAGLFMFQDFLWTGKLKEAKKKIFLQKLTLRPDSPIGSNGKIFFHFRSFYTPL